MNKFHSFLKTFILIYVAFFLMSVVIIDVLLRNLTVFNFIGDQFDASNLLKLAAIALFPAWIGALIFSTKK